MSGTDYILGLMTIVTGLAVTDMIASLHGLLMNRRLVTWDWLALLAAAFVFLLIVNTWRMTYVAFEGSVKGPPIWLFLLILAPTISLYLAARAALPDKVEVGERFDLGEYYDFVDRYLWSAIAVLYGTVVLLGGLTSIMRGGSDQGDMYMAGVIGFPVALALAIWPTRKLHRIVVPFLFIWLCSRVLPARLWSSNSSAADS
jgi:hypothetical protein